MAFRQAILLFIVYDIIRLTPINSVTLPRMEVPCRGGLERAVKKALQVSGRSVPSRTVTIAIDGKILDEQEM